MISVYSRASRPVCRSSRLRPDDIMCLSQSGSAALMRVCQASPFSRNAARTSASRRIVIETFCAAARGRRSTNRRRGELRGQFRLGKIGCVARVGAPPPQRSYLNRDSSACASAISGISGVGRKPERHGVNAPCLGSNRLVRHAVPERLVLCKPAVGPWAAFRRVLACAGATGTRGKGRSKRRNPMPAIAG